MALDPLSALSAIGGLGLGLVGINSQCNTNAANMAFNRELFDFQKYQYADMKRYNSMSEQVRRMKAAGLNPALLLQNGTTGMQASSVSSPSVNPMNPLDVSGVGSAISDIANLGSDIGLKTAQQKNVEANTANTEQDTIDKTFHNEFARDLYKFGLEKLKKGINLTDSEKSFMDARTRMVGLEAQYAENTMQNRINQQKYEMELTAAQMEAKQIATAYVAPQAVASIQRDIAQAYYSVLSGRASVSQAHASLMHATNEKNAFDAQYGSTKQQRSDFFDATLDALEAAYDQRESEAFVNTKQNRGWQVGSKLFGSVSYNSSSAHTDEFSKWAQEQRSRRYQRRKRRAEGRARGLIK